MHKEQSVVILNSISIFIPGTNWYSSLLALARECADVYQTWANIPEPIPPVRYPRTPGYRPAPEDNPNNAWFVLDTAIITPIKHLGFT